jgi:hypothetical protein
MIGLKELINLPHGKAEAVLKREGHWVKETFKVRVTGYYAPPLETKVVTVEAYNAREAELEAERKSDFDGVDKTEIIGDE